MIQMQGQGMSESVALARVQRCKKFINAAIQYRNKGDTFRTALCIQVINNEKLYLESNYKNIYDLSKGELGVTKVTTSNYLNVAKKFLDSNTGKSIFASENGDFNFTQLVELKKLSLDDAKELINSGVVTVDSSAKDIKQVVAEFKARIKGDIEKAKEDSLKPLNEAYEEFHKAFNLLYERISDDESKDLMQKIMDSVVVLYNENDRLWN